MVNKVQLLRRLLVLGCLLLLCVGLAGGQLMQLQLINGEDYVRRSASFLTTTSTVSAARGEILDRYGRAMVTNQTGFSLVLIYSSFWEDKEDRFEILLDLANRVKADGAAASGGTAENPSEDGTETDADTAEEASGAVLNDAMPITDTAPYAYVGAEGDSERKALSDYIKSSADTLGLTAVQDAKTAASTANEENPQYDADGNAIDQVAAIDATTLVSASEFISAMRTYMEEKLGMPTGLSDADARTLVGLYYSMRRVSFSNNATFTLADNVSMDLIAYIKEHHQQYTGVDVQSEAIRKYDTTYAAHVLGTVGAMYTEEWEGTDNGGPYKNKQGYNMNDTIGKSGLEAALEEYLHGTAGSRTVETDLGGDSITDHANSYAPQPGDNVITTIDLELQAVAEQSLANYLSSYERGGAAVALDPNTGEVLVMASYPTYSLADYYQDDVATARIQDKRSPELNRATGGQYPPGSTFKVLTAIAALEEGIIDANTTYTCDGVFEYGGQKFTCGNHEQPMTLDVTQAIKYSCNVYFYNVGQKLTGAHLEQWCDRFGLGNVTGIEIGESAGQAAGPTEREQHRKTDPLLREWQGGDDVNAAIGQSDNLFTPLQLANYMAAVVNGGTLYQPTLVKSIKTYDYSDVVEEKKPEAVGTIEFSDATRDLVMQGMSEVTAEGGTAATTFADYPIKVGGKTGSAEMTEYKDGVEINYTNGLFVAFAPFDDPEIVICVVGEGAGHGSAVAPVVRDILDAYFAEEEPDTVESVQEENTMVP